jgi:DNA-binding phage protein
MDQNTLMKIARLRTLAARNGKAFDVVKFAEDRQFARQTLTALMDTGDADLLMAGLELMNALGMMSAMEGKPASPAAEPATPSTDQRYIGKLRGL